MVVNKLADAFEQGSLCVGGQVCLVVEAGEKAGAAVLKLNITPKKSADLSPLGEKMANFNSF